MTRFSCVFLFLVSFFGFSSAFAAQHGGHSGGRPGGGGAHFSAPRPSAPRPSMSHGGVHVNAPRPGVHVNTMRPQSHYVPAPRPYYPPVMSYARPYDTNHSHYYGGYGYGGGCGLGLAAAIVDRAIGYDAPCVRETCDHRALVWSDRYGSYVCQSCGQPVAVPTAPRPARFYYNEP